MKEGNLKKKKGTELRAELSHCHVAKKENKPMRMT